jgi:hypothetical protein
MNHNFFPKVITISGKCLPPPPRKGELFDYNFCNLEAKSLIVFII